MVVEHDKRLCSRLHHANGPQIHQHWARVTEIIFTTGSDSVMSVMMLRVKKNIPVFTYNSEFSVLSCCVCLILWDVCKKITRPLE